uniref:Non-specific serine/threonine protein kinase n=1 Tax=Trypanosoma vivax (strain Y486) TaxID=1055687 RepID=G0TVJ5_TRYVY|nr:conserved hypothetical protein, fragment [Trypanosoma vivax Y486]
MAARLEAIARDYFSPHEDCQKGQGRAGSIGVGIPNTTSKREEEKSTASVAQFDPSRGIDGNSSANCVGEVSIDEQGPMQLTSLDETHFLPPLLQYFSRLSMDVLVSQTAHHSSDPSSLARAHAGEATQWSASWFEALRCAPGSSDPVLNVHRCEAGGRRRARSTLRDRLSQNGWHMPAAWESRCGSREAIDVFANFSQPPLSDAGASYESLDKRHQQGLAALAALVKACNDSLLRDGNTTATLMSKKRFPFGVVNVDTASPAPVAVTPSPTPTLSDYRDSIICSLNKLLRDMMARGERVLMLHIISCVVTWRFSSRNERVTILHNYIRSCLPTIHTSTATLAMEAWGKLHAIEASSSVYLKITSDMLHLAYGFLRIGCSIGECISGLIIIRHIVLWPGSLYRALLSSERGALFFVTALSLFNETFPPRVRELAAATLRDLFFLALRQKSYQPVRTILQWAITPLLSTERQLDTSSCLSNVSPRTANANDTPVSVAAQAKVLTTTATTATTAKATPSTSRKDTKSRFSLVKGIQPVGRAKDKVVSFGKRALGSVIRRLFPGVSRHDNPTEATSASVATSMPLLVPEVNWALMSSFEAPSLSLPTFCSPRPNICHISPSVMELRTRPLHQLLASLKRTPNFEVAFHAGTLAIGAFVSALLFCFPDWEPADANGHGETLTTMQTPSIPTHIITTSCGDLASKRCFFECNCETGVSPVDKLAQHAGTLGESSVTSTFREASHPARASRASPTVTDMESVSQCTEVGDLASEAASGDGMLAGGKYEDLASKSCLGNSTIQQGLCTPKMTASPSRLFKRTLLLNVIADDNGGGAVDLNALLPARKLLDLCLSPETHSNVLLSQHADRLLPILALYSPHSLKASDVSDTLRLLAKRARDMLEEATTGSRARDDLEKEEPHYHGRVRNKAYTVSPGFSAAGAPTTLHTTREKDIDIDPSVLSLINLGLFISSVASTHTESFEAAFMEYIHPILLRSLLREKPGYCFAAFAVLTLITHNIPEEMRGRLQLIVERLTEVAVAAPFNVQMIGVMVKICNVYEGLRAHCYSALLQRIEEVLSSNGTERYCGIQNPARRENAVEASANTAGDGRCWLSMGAEDSDVIKKKIMCFRVLQAFCMEWEGTAYFFLWVCAPYLHHSDTLLRRECVQACVRLPLSDCIPPSASLLKAISREGFPLATDDYLLGFTACNVRYVLHEALEADSERYQPFYSCSTRDDSKASHGGKQTRFPRSCPDHQPIGFAGFTSYLFLGNNINGNQGTNENYSDAYIANKTDSFVLKSTTLPLHSQMSFICDSHCGRLHNKVLSEILHRLVAVALCDPEESIRHAALRNFTKETDQFLYTHVEVVNCFLAALNDEFPPNRVEAVRILRRLAHYVPSSIYPRLRKALLTILQDIKSFLSISCSTGGLAMQQQQLLLPRQAGCDSNRVPCGEGSSNNFISMCGCSGSHSFTRFGAEQMAFLFELLQSVPHSIPLYMDTILQLLQQMLVPYNAAERGTIVTALHMLSYLMDECTREEWPKFEILLKPLSQQLLSRDCDADRLHAAISTLQKLIQYVVVVNPFGHRSDLKFIVGSLYSLLNRKPSIGTELSLSVLKLLGTISTIHTDLQSDDIQNAPLLSLGSGSSAHIEAFCRLPLQPLHSNAGRLPRLSHCAAVRRGRNGDMLSLQFTVHLWPDIIMRVLLRTFSEALEGVLAFNDEELQACLQTAVTILRDDVLPFNLQLYMPSLLSVLAGLIERTDEDAPLRVCTMENIADLVQVAGRNIVPMYSLLVAFLDQHLASSHYSLPSCCKLLTTLCEVAPDLVQGHCEWFLSLLLGKLSHLVEKGVSAPTSMPTWKLDKNYQMHPPFIGCTSSALLSEPSTRYQTTTTTIIRDVLNTILKILPIADQSTVQYVCRRLSQLLRIAGGAVEVLGLDKDSAEPKRSPYIIVKEEVSREIVLALVDLLYDYDLTMISTVILESVLELLKFYAEAHKMALQSISNKMHLEELKSGCRDSPLQALCSSSENLAHPPSRAVAEKHLERARGNQQNFVSNSTLARLEVSCTDANMKDCLYTFPFRETGTSWESQVEIDLIGCMLLVACRCRPPGVSYDLMIRMYLKERFEDSQEVVEFFRIAMGSNVRLRLVSRGTKRCQNGQQERVPDSGHAVPARASSIHKCANSFEGVTSIAGNNASSLPALSGETKDEGSGEHNIHGKPGTQTRSAPIPVRLVQPLPNSFLSLGSPMCGQTPLNTDTASFIGPASAAQYNVASTHECMQVVMQQNSASSFVRRGTDRSGASTTLPTDADDEQQSECSSNQETPQKQYVCSRVKEGMVDTKKPLPVSPLLAQTATEEDTFITLEDRESSDMGEGSYNTHVQRSFQQHEAISKNEWCPWFEQFCTMLVENSTHVCVSSCTPLVRRHFSIFSSDLFPIAFLSHLVKCDDAGVRRWMKSLCNFVCMHDHVPYAIAAEFARLTHHIRLYSSSIFSPSLAKVVIEEYITLNLVTKLAELSLNTPLLLLCLEQRLLEKFSWDAMARYLGALEDMNLLLDPHICSKKPLVRGAVQELLGRRSKGMATKTKHATKSTLPNAAANKWTEAGTENQLGTFACDATLPWENSCYSVVSPLLFLSSLSWKCATDSTIRSCDGFSVAPDNGNDNKRKGKKTKNLQFPTPAILELGWYETALRGYLRTIYSALRGCNAMRADTADVADLVGVGKQLPCRLSPSVIVGAMRCYMRVYDFESILNLWKATKHIPFACEDEVHGEATEEQRLERSLLRTVWSSSKVSMKAYIADYVVAAAKALSRWDIADEISYEDFCSKNEGDGTVRPQAYKEFPFYKQMEIFRAAALVAAKEYTKAKGVLASLRTALRDSYSVYYTESTRLKFELGIMFQEISDLEEGIDAIELKRAMSGGGNETLSSSFPTACVGTGCVSSGPSLCPSICCSPLIRYESRFDPSPVAGVGAGRDAQEPQHGRHHERAAYTEATVRRLQNIAGRLLPAHTTVLQRFEIIAVRNALVPPMWQLHNILVLSEHIALEGKPSCALQTIDYFSLSSGDNTEEECDYRDTLLLESFRIKLRHLAREADLVRLYRDIINALAPKGIPNMETQLNLMHPLGASALSFDNLIAKEPHSERNLELLVLFLGCRRKFLRVHAKHGEASTYTSSMLDTYTSLDSGPSRNNCDAHISHPASPRFPLRFASLGNDRDNRDANANHVDECTNLADVLLWEYRMIELAITPNNTVASVWREFGLLLFDICTAIFAEWSSTRERATLENFCTQSKSAIKALQKSVQFWNNTSTTSITGVGPFSSTSTRRLRHARSALTSVHLLLKSLHLAMKLEEVVSNSANAGRFGLKETSDAQRGGEKVGHDTGNVECDDTSIEGDVSTMGEWDSDAGFAWLDFSPAMYVHWGYILPFLVNAAARHRKLYDAVRDMCSHSRVMLYQCVYQLVSTFEHRYCTLLAQELQIQEAPFCREEGYCVEKQTDLTPCNSPFPCRDPSVFRLTGCLVSPLPLKSPYGMFLSSATQCLYSILQYRRDLVGIVQFGLEDMRSFAWHPSSPRQVCSPAPSRHTCARYHLQQSYHYRGPVQQRLRRRSREGSVDADLGFNSPSMLRHVGASARDILSNPGTLTLPLQVATPICPRTETPVHVRTLTSPIVDVSVTRIPESPGQAPSVRACSPLKLYGCGTGLERGGAVTYEETISLQQNTEPNDEERKRSQMMMESGVSLHLASVFMTNGPSQDALAGRTPFQPLQQFLPRLFDCTSILVKLEDDLLPLRDEPVVDPFLDTPMEKSVDSTNFFSAYDGRDMVGTERTASISSNRSGTSSSSANGSQTAQTATEGDDAQKNPEEAAAAVGGSSERWPLNASGGNTVHTVEERVVQLIAAATNHVNLLGTADDPHQWRSWAPHW